MSKHRLWSSLLPVFFIAGLLAGCESLDVVTQLGTAVAVSQGAITESQGESIRKGSAAVGQAFTDITPEQEYYIGRAVGATVLERYQAYDNAAATRYLNTVGVVLAQASEQPETFAGYHFLILDSDEINAFAAPGGLIFVSRGMLRCCRNEEELAAVLAHEIGHIQQKHGLQAIKKSRITTALTVLGTESAKQLGGQELADLTEAFEGSIRDVTATLVNNGYSRAFEYEADSAAVTILGRVGYDTGALVTMLETMQARLKTGGPGFGKTHPAPAARIGEIGSSGAAGGAAEKSVRLRGERFQRHLAGV